jgi:uncharacterized caspase-like protein
MKIKTCLIALFMIISITTHSKTPKLILPTGHLGGVTKINLSPNKKLILTEDLNSDIILFDSDKLIELQRFNYKNLIPNSSTFLNDSSIITICNDTIISVWNFYNDNVSLYPIETTISKIYVEKHGVYCIDKNNFLSKIKFFKSKIYLEKLIDLPGRDICFKSENEIIIANNFNLKIIKLDINKKIEGNFNNEITALSRNSKGNILIGFDNGNILECDSNLNKIHKYSSISDRISVLDYLDDTIIISGSYDYSIVIQNKENILYSKILDDWIIGLNILNHEILVCSWNGSLKKLTNKLEDISEFLSITKKATFFCQQDNNLFISYNDGSINLFNVKSRKLKDQFKISEKPILGIDASNDVSELIIWDENGIKIFNLKLRKLIKDIKTNNVVTAKFIPNTQRYAFSTTNYLYYLNKDEDLDSIPLTDSWSIKETRDKAIIACGLNRIIEINQFEVRVIDLKEIGLIYTTQKNIDGSYLIGTSNSLYKIQNNKIYKKIADFTMIVDEIEFIDNNEILINCENGQLLKINLNTELIKIIDDTKHIYSSWDFVYNKTSRNIIYPNSKRRDYIMDIDLLDLNGKIINKLENVGGQVVCISNSNKSIEFNHLDSNEVIFIVSDGSVKLWNIYSGGKEPITKLGFDYYNLIDNKLKNFKQNEIYLNSGLLKLPIQGVDTLTFITLKNEDWLVYDSKYRFDGTPGAIEKLYFTCGLEIIELSQIKDSLYVPNLIERYTNGENIEHLPKINDLVICEYTPVLIPIDSLNYKIIPRIGGVGEVAVYINGIQRFTFNDKDLVDKKGYYTLNIDENKINEYRELGKSTKIKVVAKTSDNSISSKSLIVEIRNNKAQLTPSIHAIMIGIDQYKDESLQLNFAAKDANDLQKALEIACQNYFNVDDTNRVFFYNLTVNNEGKTGTSKIKGITPDRINIIKTLHQIEKTSKPEDIILLFFAGHGEIVENEQLLLLTTESSKNSFQGIQIKELMTIMNKIPAGKRVLILDACHSGAAINNINLKYFSGKRDVQNAKRESQRLKELDKLAYKCGFAVISATNSDQKAIELAQYEHGLLTYSLLSALLRNKSALKEDNQLALDRWFIAAEEEMLKINNEQNAEKMMQISFNIGIVDDEVKKSIQIAEIPILEIGIVINENQFNNELYPLDNLEIGEKIKASINSLNSSKTNRKILLIESGDSTNYKLLIKYNVSKNEIKIKCNILKDDSLIFKLERIATLEKIDDIISSLTDEIVSIL